LHDTNHVLQAQLEAEGGGDDEGLQLDAAQLAEYRKLKGEADAKTSRLLQDRTTLEAQLKVGAVKVVEIPYSCACGRY
jgi:hypothetical protein